MTSDTDIEQLTVLDILKKGHEKYIIPMYQRNYAWGSPEITQLIQDITDYVSRETDYYIGNLVVASRSNGEDLFYETIDGQQRLTTLTLLACYLKHQSTVTHLFSSFIDIPLGFESRQKSNQTLEYIFFSNKKDINSTIANANNLNSDILSAYNIIGSILTSFLSSNKNYTLKKFANYFLHHVKIMRISVPSEDLNHYFEIMNNRGEQLEKHEILKASLMEHLEESERNHLNFVWEACSDMAKYVHTGFTPEQREAIFTDGGALQPEIINFDELHKKLQFFEFSKTQDKTQPKQDILPDEHNKVKLLDLLSLHTNYETPQTPFSKSTTGFDTPERFSSVINFQNFLLQVLRLSLPNSSQKSTINVRLDDKFLLDDFEKYLGAATNKTQAAKDFSFNLLRFRSLFDQNIIKRESTSEKDGWSLKRYQYKNKKFNYINTFSEEEASAEDEDFVSQKILMLQAAFHVSTPTMTYKQWLLAAMMHLAEIPQNESVNPIKYLDYLESVAKAFMCDRYLAEQPLDYDDIISYKGNFSNFKWQNLNTQTIDELLSYQNIRNNFVFNYLDYLLWKTEIEDNKPSDPKITSFRFTARSSVEHFYPQHPQFAQPLQTDTDLNCFGNLCLIDAPTNSRLSDRIPKEKAEYYRNRPLDSIKQYLMMKKADCWDEETISAHDEEMKMVLIKNLADNGKSTRQDA